MSLVEHLIGAGLTGMADSVSDAENTEREFIHIRNKDAIDKAREGLLEELRKVTIPKIISRADVIGTIGRTTTFGYGRRRFQTNGEFASNKAHTELFAALVKYGNRIVPTGFQYSSITLNYGVKAKKHKDGQNVGRSVIVGIGDYTGGKVKLWDKDDKNPIEADIHDKPLMFNGAKLFHQTTPFKGERYTLIYYNQIVGAKIKGVSMVGGIFA